MKSIWMVVALLLASVVPVSAQVVGDTYKLQFDHAPETVVAGRTLAFRVYIDGVATDPVLGPPVGITYTLNLPTVTTAGTKTYRVTSRWLITDPTKFVCAPTVAVAPAVALNCTEQTSPTLTVVFVTELPVLAAPGNLRIIK